MIAMFTGLGVLAFIALFIAFIVALVYVAEDPPMGIVIMLAIVGIASIGYAIGNVVLN